MKRFVKTSVIAALALAMTTFGAVQAQAWGWPVAAGVFGGLAVGTAVGVTVANAAAPVYYSYPAPVYAAPRYCAPAPVASYAPGPAVVAVAPGPAYYGPRAVYSAPYPYYRAGFGWGPRYYYGGHYYYHYRR